MLEYIKAHWITILVAFLVLIVIIFAIYKWKNSSATSAEEKYANIGGQPCNNNQQRPQVQQTPLITVLYYSMPQCGYCEQFNPEWDNFVDAVRDPRIFTKKLICDGSQESMQQCQGVNGFPTVKIIRRGADPVTYQGSMTKDGLVSFLTEQFN